MKLKKLFAASKDFVVIIIGGFIMAAGIAVFLVDAKVVPGGVSGLSMTMHYLSDGKIPVGLMMWVFNIPLYLWGVRVLGKQFGIRTLVGFTSNSFFVDLLRGSVPGFRFIHLHDHPSVVALQQSDFFMQILVGSVLMGIGLGIIFKAKGSTAGSDVLAAVANKKWGTKPGVTFMVVDSLVILLAAVVLSLKGTPTGRPVLTLTLYAFLLLFVSSRIVDVILDGFDYARSAFIMSTKNDEIAKVIMNDMSRGATAFEARGLYKNTKREVLYTVLSRKELSLLMEEVREIDPDAFIIVNNVHEVLGEGFRPRV
ncbi:YitT family protein [bacterium]|nr:YitT family protein [bacterium]